MPPESRTSKLPVEVELVLDVMPCLAMRHTYDSTAEPHSCTYFNEWGAYHSYDYASAGPPDSPKIDQPVVYAGKRRVVPELLSGCRKSPILCVGINPNLPGWGTSTRSAIHPYFDDVLQYAHYFRYRTRDKLRIPLAVYRKELGAETDTPATTRPLVAPETDIKVERAPVLMYEQYQTLLDELAKRKKWRNHKLTVGEDISYANMVACPSTRWVITESRDDKTMPIMGNERAKGIVHECFYTRKHFLRQLFQSLPAVIVVFSQTTSREFISALKNKFTKGDPKPAEALADLFKREIRMSYGKLSDGTELDARVVFMPHASARPDEFAAVRKECVDLLEEEVDRGSLVFNKNTGHLARARGACVFCANSLYKIGTCDYEQELKPLTISPAPFAADPIGNALIDKKEQLRMLDEFMAPPQVEVMPAPMAAGSTDAPAVVLLGAVVPMNGDVIPQGAVYVSKGKIAAVLPDTRPAPSGFGNAPKIATNGVIYPGLLDLHNHLPYNILPLWQPPRKFNNRDDWQRVPQYRRDVTEPMKVIVASGQGAIKAVIRYIEVKLLLGGVTSGQGMRSSFGGNRFYQGLVRNFEVPDVQTMVAAGSRVLNLTDEDVPQMRRSLDSGLPFFFHLAEGVNDQALKQYTLAAASGLLRANLIGIHSLALKPAHHRAFAQAKSTVVWSPLSNSLLYGQTINPDVLVDAGSGVTLGSDWTPSGSRNILQELKVAWLCAQQSPRAKRHFSFRTLAEMVTTRAAAATGWTDAVGSIEKNKLADLIVVDAKHADPYENLVRATEREVKLVMVGGVSRYGAAPLMAQTGLPAARFEAITVGGTARSLYLQQPGSPLNRIGFAQAKQRLEAAMADLNAVRNAPEPLFEPLSDEPRLEIELDMQAEHLDVGPVPLATLPPLPTIPLDAPTIIDDADYFDQLEKVRHLPRYLKGARGLRGFYE